MDNEQLKNDQISIIALDNSKLEGIAGGMSVEELAELLSNRAKHEFGELADEQLAKVAGGEGILDDLDPALLELLRQRPQF